MLARACATKRQKSDVRAGEGREGAGRARGRFLRNASLRHALGVHCSRRLFRKCARAEDLHPTARLSSDRCPWRRASNKHSVWRCALTHSTHAHTLPLCLLRFALRSQVKQESMIEDINNILNAGEVPNLFASDEVSQICEGLQGKAKEVGLQETTPAAMWRLFVQMCRSNLHVVLCMSPIGDAFRTRLRKFPSLVNCCTIDWFTEWPRDALLTVARSFMADVTLEDQVRRCRGGGDHPRRHALADARTRAQQRGRAHAPACTRANVRTQAQP
eukprot:1708043-Pleurochrysis_carterae.AAC.3